MDLRLADLSGADLRDTQFVWANLTNANLNEANLREADLHGANLTNANLTRTDLSLANLAGAYLTGAYLTNSNLQGADLRGANLTNANLYGAYLIKADLTRADLYKADLRSANLVSSILSHSNLEGANLSGAYMEGANVYEANVEGADFSQVNPPRFNLKVAKNPELVKSVPVKPEQHVKTKTQESPDSPPQESLEQKLPGVAEFEKVMVAKLHEKLLPLYKESASSLSELRNMLKGLPEGEHFAAKPEFKTYMEIQEKIQVILSGWLEEVKGSPNFHPEEVVVTEPELEKIPSPVDVLADDMKEIALRTGVKRISKVFYECIVDFWSRKSVLREHTELDSDYNARLISEKSKVEKFFESEAGQGVLSYLLGFTWTLVESEDMDPKVQEYGNAVAKEVRIQGGANLLSEVMDEIVNPLLRVPETFSGITVGSGPSVDNLEQEVDIVLRETRNTRY